MTGRRVRLVVALAAAAWLLAAALGPVLAASPAPSAGSDYGGDTRTSGQGPGLVGSPLYAIGGVLAVALISIGLTTVYVRATTPRSGEASAGAAAGSSAPVDEAERP
ncbi:MAG TPA: hypothetical protein VKR24_13870 [Candidatus Limnocylindrales bacterium]|nr:hypothetical protein [Candidatus Limnocylindrales bacterium]